MSHAEVALLASSANWGMTAWRREDDFYSHHINSVLQFVIHTYKIFEGLKYH